MTEQTQPTPENVPPPLRPFKDEWEEISQNLLVKNGIPVDSRQYRESKRLFYMGMMTAMLTLSRIASAKLTEAEEDQNTEARWQEVLDVLQTMAAEDKVRAEARKNLSKIIIPGRFRK